MQPRFTSSNTWSDLDVYDKLEWSESFIRIANIRIKGYNKVKDINGNPIWCTPWDDEGEEAHYKKPLDVFYEIETELKAKIDEQLNNK